MRYLCTLMALLSLLSANADECELKVYSNGDYGIDYLGNTNIPFTYHEFYEGIPDGKGNFYSLIPGYFQKMNIDGEFIWQVAFDGDASRFSLIDDELFLPITVMWGNSDLTYGEQKFTPTNESSYFLLKIDISDGSVKKSFELESDNFVDNGFNPFDLHRNGYAVSPEGDLWFMFDINEDYSRVNKDNPVSFSRYGDNDKCLYVFSKDLELKNVFCLGSDKNDETEDVNSDHLSPYMTFAGDTLFMYVPFLGKECNISLDPENPVIAKNKNLSTKACAAFCKYLVKDDKIDLLAYNVINGNDGQIKRFAVNSQNKIVGAQPLRVWDGGDDYFYDILPNMTLRKLEGYAYVPTWNFNSKQESRFWFDANDDIIRMGGTSSDMSVKFTEDIELNGQSIAGTYFAKYDGVTLENKWVLAAEETGTFPYFREDASNGMVYMVLAYLNNIDLDPSENEVYGRNIIARYKETYRIKSSSEHATIEVNGGNDMVRHGEDAEVVITPEAGFHIESVSTAKGDKVDFSWDGRCSIKNVTEPIELVITTGDGENSVDQVDAVALGVYPNPVKDILNVDDAEGSSYEVIDLAGNVASAGVIYGGKIATSQLAKGTYVLTIKKEIGAYSTMIIKE